MFRYLVFLTAIVAQFFVFSAEATSPQITVKSGDQEIKFGPLDLSSISFKPVRSLKEDWEKQRGSGFLNVFELVLRDGDEIKASYTVPTNLKSGKGLRITLYQICSDNGDDRYMKMLFSGFYEPGKEVPFKIKAKQRKENYYIATAEEVQSENEVDQHIQFMKKLTEQNQSLKVTGVGTNFMLSDVKFTLQASNEKSDFVLLGSEGFNKLFNPYWIVIVYPKYQ